MGDNSSIEWTDATWNPMSGCTKISPGCDHCYAEVIAERFRGQKSYPNGFDLTFYPERLEQPLKWQRPRRIFVSSMGDLFHKDVPAAFLNKVFSIMEQARWHRFQILTKRSSLMLDYVNHRYQGIQPPSQIWFGVSVEDAARGSRITHLRAINGANRFLSIEPLLGDIGTLNLFGIGWVIVGGESGRSARAMHPDWVRGIRRQCLAAGVPFFFKQWGEWQPLSTTSGEQVMPFADYILPGPSGNGFGFLKKGKGASGRVLDGTVWSDIPENLKLTDWPY